MPRRKGSPNPQIPPIEHRFKPGVAANPGGAPKGKRISTWIVEFMQLPQSEWPDKKTLPAAALIAMARIEKALQKDFGEYSTQIILERTEGKMAQKIIMEESFTEEEKAKIREKFTHGNQ